MDEIKEILNKIDKSGYHNQLYEGTINLKNITFSNKVAANTFAINTPSYLNVIELRAAGQFRGNAFYLSSAFSWVILHTTYYDLLVPSTIDNKKFVYDHCNNYDSDTIFDMENRTLDLYKLKINKEFDNHSNSCIFTKSSVKNVTDDAFSHLMGVNNSLMLKLELLHRKSFFLNKYFDWKLIRDSNNILCLLPLKPI